MAATGSAPASGPPKKKKRKKQKPMRQQLLAPLKPPPPPQRVYVVPSTPREFISSYFRNPRKNEKNTVWQELCDLFHGLPSELQTYIRDDLELDLYVSSKIRAIQIPMLNKTRWLRLVPHQSMERTQAQVGWHEPWYKRMMRCSNVYLSKPEPFMLIHEDDPEVIFSLIYKYGASKFSYASERLRNSIYLFTYALQKGKGAFKDGSTILRGNAKYYDLATKRSPEPYRFASLALRRDKKRFVSLVKQHKAWYLLKYAPKCIKTDVEIASLCIANHPSLASIMTYDWEEDNDILHYAMLRNGEVVLHIKDLDFKENRKLFLECFKRAPRVIRRIYLCAPHLITLAMSMKAVKYDPGLVTYIPCEIRRIPRFYKAYLKLGGCVKYVLFCVDNQREENYVMKLAVLGNYKNVRHVRYIVTRRYGNDGASTEACCEERNEYILLALKKMAAAGIREEKIFDKLRYFGCGYSLPCKSYVRKLSQYERWLKKNKLKRPRERQLAANCHFCDHYRKCHCRGGPWTPDRVLAFYTKHSKKNV